MLLKLVIAPNKAIKLGPQKDVGRTAFHAAPYGKRYIQIDTP
jgi:hypothetical protein